MPSKYEIPLAQHKKMKQQFLDGKTIREMGIEHQMANLEVLSFVRWTAKEFRLEQLLRMDQALGKLMRLASTLLDESLQHATGSHIEKVAECLKQVDRTLNRFSSLSAEREVLMPRKGTRPQGPDGKFLPKEDSEAGSGALEDLLDEGDGE